MDICSQLEAQLDGTTPAQEDAHNTGGALNHGFVQDDDCEVDRDMGEIQIGERRATVWFLSSNHINTHLIEYPVFMVLQFPPPCVCLNEGETE